MGDFLFYDSEPLLCMYILFSRCSTFLLVGSAYFHYLQLGHHGFSCWKKSLPLSSTRMKAGKSSTVIFQSYATDCAEIEAAVLLASVSYHL